MLLLLVIIHFALLLQSVLCIDSSSSTLSTSSSSTTNYETGNNSYPAPPFSSLTSSSSTALNTSELDRIHNDWTSLSSSSSSTTTTTSTSSPHEWTLPRGKIDTIWQNVKTFTSTVQPRKYQNYERRYRSCPSLRNALPNGWVKLRSSRLARFYCNQGYDLFGTTYATCSRSRNRWIDELPICVSSRCPLKINVQRPLIVKKSLNHNSVIDLSCELGYDLRMPDNLSASRTNNSNNALNNLYTTRSALRLYCVGRKWLIDDYSDNQSDRFSFNKRIPLKSFPQCEVYEKSVNKSMNCDFEELSFCGWFQDPDDDFDWTLNYHATPSHYDETGPSFDHTLGQNHSGYYIYLESSYPRIPNEVSRLYSPVYEHIQNATVACFQFYYHMYGRAIGSLKVYIKEKTSRLSELNPSWEMSGDQGDQWLIGQVEIQPSQTETLHPFQIIIEGVLGSGHQSDIAIDDLSLTLGKSCSSITNVTDVKVDLEINVDDLDKDFDTNSTSTLPTPSQLVWSDASDQANDNDEQVGDIVRSIVHLRSNYPRNSTTTTTSTVSPVSNLTPDPSTSTTSTPSSITEVSKSFNYNQTTTTNSTFLSKWKTWKNWTEHFKKKIQQHQEFLNNLTSTTSTTTSTEKSNEIVENGETVNSSQLAQSSTTTTISPSTSSVPIIIKPESLKAGEQSLLNKNLPVDDNNGGNDHSKNRYKMHWLFIVSALVGLFAIIGAIIYGVVYHSNWPLYRHWPDYHFVAIFVNRCKVFNGAHRSNNGSRRRNIADDDAEMLVNNSHDDVVDECFNNNQLINGAAHHLNRTPEQQQENYDYDDDSNHVYLQPRLLSNK